MNTLDEIKDELNTEICIPKNDDPKVNVDLKVTPELLMEIKSLRDTVESILIFLKITDRMTEAQYRFVFSHVTQTEPREDEDIDSFLSRSAIELEKKMKNMGLLK